MRQARHCYSRSRRLRDLRRVLFSSSLDSMSSCMYPGMLHPTHGYPPSMDGAILSMDGRIHEWDATGTCPSNQGIFSIIIIVLACPIIPTKSA